MNKIVETMKKEAGQCIDSMVQTADITETELLNTDSPELDLYYLGAFETIMRILGSTDEYLATHNERLDTFYTFCLGQEVS